VENSWILLISGLVGGLTAGFLWKQIDFSKSSLKVSSPTLRDLEARMKSVESEWETMYQKFRSLHGKLTKERGLADRDNDGSRGEPGPGSTQVDPVPRSRLALLGRKHAG